MKIKQHEQSAIIGYYRQGATFVTISWITGFSEVYIRQIVREYLEMKGEKMISY